MQEKPIITPFNVQNSYAEMLKTQELRVKEVVENTSPETLFIGEHAPVYTCGSSGNEETDVLGTFKDIPVIKSGRGGQITYHGPGQIVAYPIFDLRERGRDLRAYICFLQKAIIATLKDFGIEAHTNDDVGVWVQTKTGEKKIAAIGVRVRKWVTFHGLALNVAPNLSHFKGIVPCGISDRGVTSMAELGVNAPIKNVEEKLIRHLTLHNKT